MASDTIGRLVAAFAVASRRTWKRPFASLALCPFIGALPFSTLVDALGRKRVVFLGTPQVAALVLQELLTAAAGPNSNFEVAAVVSRPSSRQWLERQGAPAAPATQLSAPPAEASSASAHSKQLRSPSRLPSTPPAQPNWARHGASAVERLALSSGLPGERVLCPVSAKEPGFLDAMRRLRPDLAVTAAYGGMLPQAFLDIPKYGTLNIHPSLLPRYRGPAPVARALQDGCSVTGVSLVFTVLECDAGPVLEQEQVQIDSDIQVPELTEHMFRMGAAMLLRRLPGLLSGEVTPENAAPQDDAAVSYAPKVGKRDAPLDFRLSARQCHNHVRAMAGWPGARASLLVENKSTGALDPLEIKILRTRAACGPASSSAATASHSHLPPGTSGQVLYTPGGELLVPCGDGNMLSVLEVARRRGGSSGGAFPGSPAARSYLTAKDFMDGLSKRRLFVPVRI